MVTPPEGTKSEDVRCVYGKRDVGVGEVTWLEDHSARAQPSPERGAFRAVVGGVGMCIRMSPLAGSFHMMEPVLAVLDRFVEELSKRQVE